MSIAIAVFMGLLAYVLWEASRHHRREFFRIQEDSSLYGEETRAAIAKQQSVSAILCEIGAWVAGGIAFAALIYPFFLL